MPSEDSAPECARDARDGVHDAELARVVRAWPALPEAVRLRVVKLIVEATNTTEPGRLPRRG